MKTDLRAALLADAAVAGLVGENVVWGQIPQAEQLPYVQLEQISAGLQQTYQGRSRTTLALVQADCWAATYAGAEALGAAVIAALDALRGAPFQHVEVVDIRDGEAEDDAPGAARTTTHYRTSLDLRVTHTSP